MTALCPGNTETGFQAKAHANTAGMRVDSPETVARQGIAALKQGASYKIVGVDNYLQSLVPRKTVINVVGGMMSKRMKPALVQP